MAETFHDQTQVSQSSPPREENLLFVKNLSLKTSKDDVLRLLNNYKPVKKISLLKEWSDQEEKCSAIVTLSTFQLVNRAVRDINGTIYLGQEIVLSACDEQVMTDFSHSDDERSSFKTRRSRSQSLGSRSGLKGHSKSHVNSEVYKVDNCYKERDVLREDYRPFERRFSYRFPNYYERQRYRPKPSQRNSNYFRSKHHYRPYRFHEYEKRSRSRRSRSRSFRDRYY
ncbi:UNVERIFIED_CONTAM: hypothetical protein RMT77_008098 [Armadillidium vulgare]